MGEIIGLIPSQPELNSDFNLEKSKLNFSNQFVKLIAVKTRVIRVLGDVCWWLIIPDDKPRYKTRHFLLFKANVSLLGQP